MEDVSGLLVMFLMDVPIEHGHVWMNHQNLYRFGSVPRGPVPRGRQVEQRAMRENNQRNGFFDERKISLKPLQLCFADIRAGIRDVVEHNKMDAFVIEGIVRFTEQLLV